MAETTYQNIIVQVKQLDVLDQLRLLEAIASLAHRQAASKSQRSIRELRGLGKEVWNNIDAQQYVDQERDSWN